MYYSLEKLVNLLKITDNNVIDFTKCPNDPYDGYRIFNNYVKYDQKTRSTYYCVRFKNQPYHEVIVDDLLRQEYGSIYNYDQYNKLTTIIVYSFPDFNDLLAFEFIYNEGILVEKGEAYTVELESKGIKVIFPQDTEFKITRYIHSIPNFINIRKEVN